jgi:catalase
MEDRLKQKGATAELIAPHLGMLQGASGDELRIDKSLATADSVMYDAVYIPGGKESVNQLLGDYESRHFVREAYNHGKALAADREGSEILKAVGITSAPGVVFGQQGSDTDAFIEAISKHRHWNRPK